MFSIKKFPLTFPENVVHGGPGDLTLMIAPWLCNDDTSVNHCSSEDERPGPDKAELVQFELNVWRGVCRIFCGDT